MPIENIELKLDSVVHNYTTGGFCIEGFDSVSVCLKKDLLETIRRGYRRTSKIGTSEVCLNWRQNFKSNRCILKLLYSATELVSPSLGESLSRRNK